MLGREAVSMVFRRKRAAVVERQPKGSRVRLDKNVGNGYFPLEIGPFAGVMRILVAADIEPWPAVECAFVHAGDVIRHEIVAQTVAFVGGAIYVAAGGMNGHPDAIADAGGEDFRIRSVSIERENVRPP